MSSEWQSTTLGKICDSQGGAIQTGPFGSQLHTSDYKDSGIPVVMPTNIGDGGIFENGIARIDQSDVERLSQHKLRSGDIIFSRRGDVTKNALITAREAGWLCGTGCLKVRLGDESIAVARFISYCLRLPEIKDWLIRHAVGATMPNLNTGILSAVPINLPPRAIQIEIGKILGALDDRIALLRETNATLESIAQALFKSWFVDFDPVRAKLQGQMPEGMDEATAALFPDSFEESELGLVPKGWQLIPFGKLLSHTIGGDWGDEESNDKNDTKVAIIRGTDIPDLQSGNSARVPIRYTSKKKLNTRQLVDSDIVLEVSGGSKDQPTGRSIFITHQLLAQFDCPVEPASFCRLLRPISKDIGIVLSQHMTAIYAAGKTWEYQNQSTGIANFQTTHFLESELVILPSKEVLEAFAEIVRPIIDRSHLTQITQLSALRDALLPRLISGQLRITEAEDAVEEAAA
ncbi:MULTISPECIES: restriction endonuclease subunit S [unclassified Undibacterium]|uniref:restriction endonuclease subunit S n=1 Tax=unclassified Undibacterium TaxID=2630295 RepID=UPI003C2F420D